MLTTSLSYIAFVAVSFLGYTVIPVCHRKNFLLLLSVVFCSMFGLGSLLAVVFFVLFNYVYGLKIDRSSNERTRKRLLIFSIIVNTSFLGLYKYQSAISLIIFETLTFAQSNTSHIIDFPFVVIGVSFYVFQSISYLVDIYKRSISPRESIVDYALFITFFPKFTAGPIERAATFLPQLFAEQKPTYTQARSGLILILWGFFQKVVVADRLAVFVNAVYSSPSTSFGIAVWTAMIFYSFQIYCDFNGYTDIARGTAKLFGYELTINFRQPYLATSVRDFWRRWHISLSTWLRDYVYIPLGGSRVGSARKIVNLLIIFVLCGVWHGSSWTFIVWGVLHGLYVAIEVILEKIWNKNFLARICCSCKMIKYIKIILTFYLISFGWMFFRSNTIHDVLVLIKNCFALKGSSVIIQDGLSRDQIVLSIALIALIIAIDIMRSSRSISGVFFALPRVIRWTAYFALIFSLILFPGGHDIAQFIYCKF